VAERQCYHCKQWIVVGEPHDCWTTTETALTRDLAPDLLDAWERLREAAVEFGDQRIYASHNSIMFARRSCYFFVRPRRTFLEVCVFLGRAVKAPQIRRVDESSRTKFVHFLKITHRDQVEAPMTEWLQEAYEYVERPPKKASARAALRRPGASVARRSTGARKADTRTRGKRR
jgi:hypothetical protein